MRLKVSAFDRRRFLRWLGGLAGGSALVGMLAPLVRLLWPGLYELPAEVVFEEGFADLTPNHGRIVSYGPSKCLVIRMPDGSLRAFNARCTHADCTVHYDAEGRRIVCECHQGIYDLQGTNVAGPPPRPLPRYEVTRRDGAVVIRAEPAAATQPTQG